MESWRRDGFDGTGTEGTHTASSVAYDTSGRLGVLLAGRTDGGPCFRLYDEDGIVLAESFGAADVGSNVNINTANRNSSLRYDATNNRWVILAASNIGKFIAHLSDSGAYLWHATPGLPSGYSMLALDSAGEGYSVLGGTSFGTLAHVDQSGHVYLANTLASPNWISIRNDVIYITELPFPTTDFYGYSTHELDGTKINDFYIAAPTGFRAGNTYSASVDQFGNVYFLLDAGTTSGDSVVAKMDENGSQQWVSDVFGSRSSGSSRYITTDGENVYVLQQEFPSTSIFSGYSLFVFDATNGNLLHRIPHDRSNLSNSRTIAVSSTSVACSGPLRDGSIDGMTPP